MHNLRQGLLDSVAQEWIKVLYTWCQDDTFNTLPVCTFAHLFLGVSIGFLLTIKLLVLTVCPHFRLIFPYLDLAIPWCKVLQIRLSAPFPCQETY